MSNVSEGDNVICTISETGELPKILEEIGHTVIDKFEADSDSQALTYLV